jgi:alpha-beta hydrolase superfamily lysophospholipase
MGRSFSFWRDAWAANAQRRDRLAYREFAESARGITRGVAGASHDVALRVREFAQPAVATVHDGLARAWSNRPVWAVTALVSVAIVFVAFYVALAAILYFTQRSMMYFPETVHTAPAQAGLPEAQEIDLTASDGARIIAWHVAPRRNKPVIVYFHGNGGALRYRVERFRKLMDNGIGLVGVEYRGFGGLSGSPTEAGLIADAEAAYAFAITRYWPQELVLWGESLGTGLAVVLASEKSVGRVILEAPFTSAAAVAARSYWYMPVGLLMKDQFRSDERIGKITAPVLILHGVKDQIVPYAMGERMFDLTKARKHIVRFLDGGHEDLDKNGALHAVGRFLDGDLD